MNSGVIYRDCNVPGRQLPRGQKLAERTALLNIRRHVKALDGSSDVVGGGAGKNDERVSCEPSQSKFTTTSTNIGKFYKNALQTLLDDLVLTFTLTLTLALTLDPNPTHLARGTLVLWTIQRAPLSKFVLVIVECSKIRSFESRVAPVHAEA